jgi:toxin ParE1/3/4
MYDAGECRFLPQAQEDAIEQAVYIAQDNLQAADRFLEALERSCELLATMPEMGSRRTFDNPALADVRMMPIKGFEKHLIFYRASPDGVEVIRIVHGARDLPTLFEE